MPRRFAKWPAALDQVRFIYNEQRPHEALAMERPAERYRPSSRGYAERVKEWEYPAGSDVRRLNSRGMLTNQGRRWFVCGALANCRVRVEFFDGKLLLSYRPMYMREVDVDRKCSRLLALVRGSREEHSGASRGALH